GVAVEGRADRRPCRRLDVASPVDVRWSVADGHDLAEVVVDVPGPVDRAHAEDPPGVQPGFQLAVPGAEAPEGRGGPRGQAGFGPLRRVEDRERLETGPGLGVSLRVHD